jgi:hypothetical protein
MKSLTIASPLHLNVLQVAVDSEMEFLTDALADASHTKDKIEYSGRLRSISRFKAILQAEPSAITYEEGDPSMEHLAMAVEKLILDQYECLEILEDSDEDRLEHWERINAARELLSVLRPERPTHYGSRH